jgi:hypothetical protein
MASIENPSSSTSAVISAATGSAGSGTDSPVSLASVPAMSAAGSR